MMIVVNGEVTHKIPDGEMHLHFVKVACGCGAVIKKDVVTHQAYGDSYEAQCMVCPKRNRLKACHQCKRSSQ